MTAFDVSERYFEGTAAANGQAPEPDGRESDAASAAAVSEKVEPFQIDVYTARELSQLELPTSADPLVGAFVRKAMDGLVDAVAEAVAARLLADGLAPAPARENGWRLLTLAEASECLGRSQRTVRKWVREGRLPRVHLDGGAWAFDPDDLREFARSRRVGGMGSLAGLIAEGRERHG